MIFCDEEPKWLLAVQYGSAAAVAIAGIASAYFAASQAKAERDAARVQIIIQTTEENDDESD